MRTGVDDEGDGRRRPSRLPSAPLATDSALHVLFANVFVSDPNCFRYHPAMVIAQFLPDS
jgi:hypothetical protein